MEEGERDLNSTSSDLLSLDPPPKCLTCRHQSGTLIGSPKDTETGGGGGEESVRVCDCINASSSAIVCM